MKTWMVAAGVIPLMLGQLAQAHIDLVYPAPRPGAVGGAFGEPCGFAVDPGRTTSQFLLPGATVEVRWTEYINHPSHFRISFDNDGQDGFADPVAYDSYYINSTVLLDDLQDPSTIITQHSATITLPNIECANCTLQLMQVLHDKPPFTNDSNSDDMHRLCADLTLTYDAEFVFDDGFED